MLSTTVSAKLTSLTPARCGACRATSRVLNDMSALVTAAGAHAPKTAAMSSCRPVKAAPDEAYRSTVPTARSPSKMGRNNVEENRERCGGPGELLPSVFVQDCVPKSELRGLVRVCSVDAWTAEQALDAIDNCNVLVRRNQRERHTVLERCHANAHTVRNERSHQRGALQQLGEQVGPAASAQFRDRFRRLRDGFHAESVPAALT